jgi:tRNA pseudouridine32 synthase/23S rRNA pseudouridine746 synthase
MTHETPKKQNIKFTCIEEDNGKLLVDTVAKNSPLSKSLIKKLMVNGGVFQSFRKTRRQVRKAKNTVKTGDTIECFYDPSIDFEKEFEFNLIFQTSNYGIFHKPAGAPTEGTNYGDKTSLLRHVEKLKRYVYLVNRLDREAEGLVVVAYNSKTQNLLQEMWRDGVVKKYQAIVLGKLEGTGSFEDKINNKYSKTSYSCVKTVDNQTYVNIELATERKNQIRIHFANNGNPVMGDPIYGENNKNKEGLMLISYCLEFIDPQNKKPVIAKIPKENLLY